MAFGIGNPKNSHNIKCLSQAASHNIRYPLYRLFDPLRRSEIHPDCHTLKSFGLRAKTVALAQPSSITIMDLEGANCL